MTEQAEYPVLHLAAAIVVASILLAVGVYLVRRWRWRRMERSVLGVVHVQEQPLAPPAPVVRGADHWRPGNVLRRLLRLLLWPITGTVEHRRPEQKQMVYMRRDEGGGGGGFGT